MSDFGQEDHSANPIGPKNPEDRREEIHNSDNEGEEDERRDEVNERSEREHESERESEREERRDSGSGDEGGRQSNHEEDKEGHEHNEDSKARDSEGAGDSHRREESRGSAAGDKSAVPGGDGTARTLAGPDKEDKNRNRPSGGAEAGERTSGASQTRRKPRRKKRESHTSPPHTTDNESNLGDGYYGEGSRANRTTTAVKERPDRLQVNNALRQYDYDDDDGRRAVGNVNRTRDVQVNNNQQQPEAVVTTQQGQQVEGGQNKKEDPMRLRLDLNLDVEVTLKARIHGDVELALLKA